MKKELEKSKEESKTPTKMHRTNDSASVGSKTQVQKQSLPPLPKPFNAPPPSVGLDDI
jgi:hypothetical protein